MKLFDGLRGRKYNSRELFNVFGSLFFGIVLPFLTPGAAATSVGVKEQGVGILENVVRKSCEYRSIGIGLAVLGMVAGYYFGLGCAESLQNRRFKISEEE